MKIGLRREVLGNIVSIVVKTSGKDDFPGKISFDRMKAGTQLFEWKHAYLEHAPILTLMAIPNQHGAIRLMWSVRLTYRG